MRRMGSITVSFSPPTVWSGGQTRPGESSARTSRASNRAGEVGGWNSGRRRLAAGRAALGEAGRGPKGRCAMHARLTRFEGSPDQIEAGTKLIKETVIPAARMLPGFKSGVWVIDR